jgi:predicted DNA-binding protein (MmcQ/YjbR family)
MRDVSPAAQNVRMTPDTLKAFCLGLNGAVETFPFSEGLSVFKVGSKVFALTALADEPLKVSLKCDPELAVQLREKYACIVPGWHLNKRHWNTVTVEAPLPDTLLRELVEDSYDLIVTQLPRKQQLALDWPGVRRVGAN